MKRDFVSVPNSWILPLNCLLHVSQNAIRFGADYCMYRFWCRLLYVSIAVIFFFRFYLPSDRSRTDGRGVSGCTPNPCRTRRASSSRARTRATSMSWRRRPTRCVDEIQVLSVYMSHPATLHLWHDANVDTDVGDTLESCLPMRLYEGLRPSEKYPSCISWFDTYYFLPKAYVIETQQFGAYAITPVCRCDRQTPGEIPSHLGFHLIQERMW